MCDFIYYYEQIKGTVISISDLIQAPVETEIKNDILVPELIFGKIGGEKFTHSESFIENIICMKIFLFSAWFIFCRLESPIFRI